MEFITPRQQHAISASVSVQFDNADSFPLSQDMYIYGDDPVVSKVDPKTAIIR